MSRFEISDMRQLCGHCQLEFSEPEVNGTLPNVFSHCEIERSKHQYDSVEYGLRDNCFVEKGK